MENVNKFQQNSEINNNRFDRGQHGQNNANNQHSKTIEYNNVNIRRGSITKSPYTPVRHRDRRPSATGEIHELHYV